VVVEHADILTAKGTVAVAGTLAVAQADNIVTGGVNIADVAGKLALAQADNTISATITVWVPSSGAGTSTGRYVVVGGENRLVASSQVARVVGGSVATTNRVAASSPVSRTIVGNGNLKRAA
jgi:hypothetical protein